MATRWILDWLLVIVSCRKTNVVYFAPGLYEVVVLLEMKAPESIIAAIVAKMR